MTSEDRRTPGNEQVIEEIRTALQTHRDEEHVFETLHLKSLVAEHREMYDVDRPLLRDTNRKVSLLVDEIYGTPHPTAADPGERIGGVMCLLTEMNDTMKSFEAQARNGGFTTTRKWTPGQWTFYGTIGAGFLAMSGAIVVALLGG